MAYSDFTLPGLIAQFQLTVVEDQELFAEIEPVAPPPSLTEMLSESAPLALAINTEKARSEMIIAPILLALRKLARPRISLFSGTDFTVAPEHGLTGFCDYIVARAHQQLFITAPVLMIFEAKNENIKAGLAQCLAAMLAAQIFNVRAGKEIETIYGAVTTGSNWKFLHLIGQTAVIDQREYYLSELDKVLGVLLHIVGADDLVQAEQPLAA
jgi:hypothetical protein